MNADVGSDPFYIIFYNYEHIYGFVTILNFKHCKLYIVMAIEAPS